MRGWRTDCFSDNHILRSSCVLNCDIDILGISESHLTGSEVLHLEGFTWFGHNRKEIHRNAKAGSGGVGFFVSNHLVSEFNITVCDNSCEGILLLKLEHKFNNFSIITMRVLPATGTLI